MCRNPAAFRGALSFNHEPTMSVFSESAAGSNRFLTVEEVRKLFRVCRRTIERETAAGHFPRPLKIGRSVRFLESDLRAYIDKRNGEGLTSSRP